MRERTEPKFTPGPWHWNLNVASKQVELECSPRRYRETVLGCTRWGMSGATLQFNNGKGVIVKAAELGKPSVGREHHADWFQIIDHPDAYLIASAPDLYAALQECLDFAKEADEDLGYNHWPNVRAALAKARGEK